MSEIPISIITVREPELKINACKYSIHDEMATVYVESLENYVLEEIIKCVPEETTKLILIDKQKLNDIFEKQIPKKVEQGRCPNCREYLETLYLSHRHCYLCGQRLEQEVRP